MTNKNHEVQSNVFPTTKLNPRSVMDKAALNIDDGLDQQEFGNKGTIPSKLLQAKIKALSVQLRDTLKLKEETERQNIELVERLKICMDEKKQLELTLLETNYTWNCQKGNEKDNIDYLRSQNEIFRKRIAKDKTIIEEAERVSIAREEKLSNLMKEIDEYKINFQSNATNRKQTKSENNQEKNIHQAYERLKMTENQNSQLIFAFKKQLRLIDILRRQKIHIEALKFMQIREQDIKQTICGK